MAGEGLKKLTAAALIFIALASGWMVVETEGMTCYRESTKFPGKCNLADDCARFCYNNESWDGGFCSGDKCICTRSQICCC